MDNLTHSFVGLLLARSGLERLSPYAVPAAVVAANVPDIDLLSVAGGRWSYLDHHRGFSHSLVGTVLLALAVPVAFWLFDQLRARIKQQKAQVRLGGLILICLIAAATHPLLDWTNNYGVRPLLPWSKQWFYGDLVFVMDPWLWLILGGAAFLLTARSRMMLIFWILVAVALSLALILARVLGLPSPASPIEIPALVLWFAGIIALAFVFRRGTGEPETARIALAALALVPLYWASMALLHHFALDRGRLDAEALSKNDRGQLTRLAVMPTFANPFRWQVLAETENADYRFTEDIRVAEGHPVDAKRFLKPSTADMPMVEMAARDPNARKFLEFARFPLAEVAGACGKDKVVRFADLRYTEPGAGRAPFATDIPIECGGNGLIGK
jgi:inner membrane protein